VKIQKFFIKKSDFSKNLTDFKYAQYVNPPESDESNLNVNVPQVSLRLFTFSGQSFSSKLLPENPFGVDIFKNPRFP